MKRCSAFLFLLLALNFEHLQAQTLQVKLSPNDSKVDRSTSNGTATIFFDSNVDDLSIVCTDENPDEPIRKIRGKKLWFMYVDVKKDIVLDSCCYRNFLLKSSSSAEYYLTTPEINYNQVLYYTVVLPIQYPISLSAEYLFSQKTKHGIRLSLGKRFGGYFSYKWGECKPAGNNIDKVTDDFDVTHQKKLGNIRTAITTGLRYGFFLKRLGKIYSTVYLLAGGGYGEYGRQWINPSLVGDSYYFYSDYKRGFDCEVATQLVLFDWLCCSIGADIVIGKGGVFKDYQIGIGANLNANKLFKRKKVIQ